MTDNRIRAYEGYLTAWSNVSEDDRIELLEKSLSRTATFINRQQTRNGLSEVAEHLRSFQTQMPGASFRLNNLVGWGAYALAEWQLVDAVGIPGFSGNDMLTFDDLGLISYILMVTNVEEQKIVWRRRADVLLELTA